MPASAVDKCTGVLKHFLDRNWKKPEQAVHNQCKTLIHMNFFRHFQQIPRNYPQGYAQRIQPELLPQRCG